MSWLRLLFPLLLWLFACGAEPEPSPGSPPYGPPLPRLWTLGPAAADLAEPALLVTLEADGRPRLDGVEVDLEELRARMVAFADGDREDHYMRHSRRLLVIRGHRRLPWRALERVLMTAADIRVGITRIAFSAEAADGGPEGTFFLALPSRPESNLRPERPGRGRILQTPTRTDQPVAPVALRQAFGELDGVTAETPFLFQAWPSTPLEYVLQVLDLLHREGVREVRLFGPPPSARQETNIATARTRGVLPGLRIGPDNLQSTGNEPAPEVRRHRKLVGFTEPLASMRHSDFYPPRWSPARPAGMKDIDNSRLDALAALQAEDGSWGDGDPALTGLALLALQRVGVTHKHSAWRKHARDALRFLKRRQTEVGSFSEDDRAHALATAAMVEAYARTGSPLFKQCAQLAIEHSRLRELGPQAVMWVDLQRESFKATGLPFLADRPAAWSAGPVGGAEGRVLAALTGHLPEAELVAWREKIRSTPVEGRTAEDLALSLLVLSTAD